MVAVLALFRGEEFADGTSDGRGACELSARVNYEGPVERQILHGLLSALHSVRQRD